jgi:hypothetical protein
MLIMNRNLEGVVYANGTLVWKPPDRMASLRCFVEQLIRKANDPS